MTSRSRQVIGCGVNVLILALALSAGRASAEEQPRAVPDAPERRFSVEGAAGFQVDYRGSMQSVGFGWSPTRSLTLLVSADRSYVADKIEQYVDGYGSERGGTEQFISGGLRYAFLSSRRVSPYVTVGTGRGLSRPNVNDYFRDERRRGIHVIYYGGGVRIPVVSRLDAFIDARVIMAVEGKSDYFGVRFPVRAGVAVRF
jgi:hypothetical protein